MVRQSRSRSPRPARCVRRPGLPGQNIQVKFAVQNTGTLWLKQLVVQDTDAAFFDAVDVRANNPIRVNFPPSADRVQVDACTGACGPADFVSGTPTASQSPPLPIPAADVRGVRITFLTANGIVHHQTRNQLPGNQGDCTGASICLNVAPRAELRSAPGTAIPDELTDSASGGYETTAQGGRLAPIPDTVATHSLTTGTAALLFDKGDDIDVAPGTTDPDHPDRHQHRHRGDSGAADRRPHPDEAGIQPQQPGRPVHHQPTPCRPERRNHLRSSTRRSSTTPARSSRSAGSSPAGTSCPGAVVTVGIEFKLAPGAQVGDDIENRAGATGTRPELTLLARWSRGRHRHR